MPRNGVERYRDDIVRHLTKLIAIESKQGPVAPGMPFGPGPHAALRYMLELARSLGMRTADLDGYCGWAEYGEGKELVCVPCHLDVVPEGTGWTRPPYGGVIEGGRVYGRGASDNKGSCVAALYALLALREGGATLKRRVRVIFGTNEESGMLDLFRYVEREGLPDLAFSPDGGFSIVNGEKGTARMLFTAPPEAEGCDGTRIVEVAGGDAPNRVPDICRAVLSHRGCRAELVTEGRTAHGASPGAGVNAALHMAALLRPWVTAGRGLLAFINEKIGLGWDGAGLGAACADALFGPLTLNAGVLKADAAGASLLVDIRYPLCTSIGELTNKLTDAAAPFGVELTVLEDRPPFHVEKDSRLIRLLSESFHEVTGEAPDVRTSGGGSYSKAFAGRCVLFGGAGAGGHGPDEYVEIGQLMRLAALIEHTMEKLATAASE